MQGREQREKESRFPATSWLSSLRTLRRRIGEWRLHRARWRFSHRHIAGAGIEIGALHSPFRVPDSAMVSYVDRLTDEQLRHHYPELADADLVPVDIVDDAETLESVASASQDFVIASHVLEHCEDPLGAVATWLRVLKPGSALVLVVPDKRYTFDRPRTLTTLEHLVRDAEDRGTSSRRRHYREWVEHVEAMATEAETVAADTVAVESRAQELEAAAYSIHFHTWDFDSLRRFLDHCVRDGGATVRAMRRNRSENLALLRNTGI